VFCVAVVGSFKAVKSDYIFDNSAHCRFLGATKTSEVVGKTVFDFLPVNIAAKFYAEDLQVLGSGEPVVRCVDESVDSAGNGLDVGHQDASAR